MRSSRLLIILALGLASCHAQPAAPPAAPTPQWRSDDAWFASFASKKKDEDEEEEDDDKTTKDDDLDPCPSPCPQTGCAVPGSGKAASNKLKRAFVDVEAKDALPLPFSALETLQEATDQRIKQGVYPSAAARASALHDIPVGSRKLSEGDIVRVAGYFANVRRAGPESVNCKLSGAANNDIHLSVVEDPGNEEFDSFVAEVIPQRRPAAWEAPPLNKLKRDGALVMVVGPLFYDAKHVVNAGPTPKHGQPKRFTLWEVHPVSAIYVCPSGTCDVRKAAGWKRLTD